MIPSSRQWAMISPTDVLVYPISMYAITTVEKRPPAPRAKRTSRRYAAISPDGSRSDRCSSPSPSPARHRRRHRNRNRHRHDNDDDDDNDDEQWQIRYRRHRHRRRRSDSRDSGGNPRRGRRSGSEGSGDRHGGRSVGQRRWRRRRRSNDDRRPSHQTSFSSVDTDVNYCSDEDSPPWRIVLDGTGQRAAERVGCGGGGNARCSANAVVLAHGNRSLHVLTIQRCWISMVSRAEEDTASRRNGHHNRTSAVADLATTAPVIRYKLPGGQLMLTDDEKEHYKQEDRDACTCSDDRRWYAAALEHFPIQSPTSVLMTATTFMDAVQRHSRFVPLGKWYRTNGKEDRREGLTAGGGGGGGGGDGNNSQQYYYPYKPSHVSRQAAEHKRVYAVPDAARLFPGGPPFRLRAPRPKVVVTTAADDGTAAPATTITRITTYKYKFVPLAKLHENKRLYGPILSSLPAVLSGIDFIFMP